MGKNSLNQLIKEYKDSLPAKIKELSRQIDELKQKKTQEALSKLRTTVHKLAGSAGTYGFSDASVHCRDFEKELIPFLDPFDEKKLTDPFFIRADAFLKMVKKDLGL